MQLCQLIHQEILKISGTQIDPEKIDPKSYDYLLETLANQNEMLEVLQQILNVSAENLDKIESYWREKEVEINSISFKELFTSRVEDITDKTVFYIGNLDYNEYEKVNTKAKHLPDSLKVVFGEFSSIDTYISDLDLDLVGGFIRIIDCGHLLRIKVQSAPGGTEIKENSDLESVTINGENLNINEDLLLFLDTYF